MSQKHSFTLEELLDFDRKIVEANLAFRKVPEYKGFDKPKLTKKLNTGMAWSDERISHL